MYRVKKQKEKKKKKITQKQQILLVKFISNMICRIKHIRINQKVEEPN